MINYQFYLTQRQDVTVTFFEPLAPGAAHELESLSGVLHSEPFRVIPCRIRSGHVSKRVGIRALANDSRLFRLRDDHERLVDIPSEGIMLSDKLARLLHVNVGELVQLDVLEGQRPKADLIVSSTIREFSGLNVYVSRGAAGRLMREQGSISGAYLLVDHRQLDDLYLQLKNMPSIASVTVKQAAIDNFRETIAENLLRMRAYNIIFASIIAFGVVYNGARVSLSERSREFATLRVMGFTRHEVSSLLLGELGILTLVAVPFGLFLGYGFAAWASKGLDTELYRIPLVVDRATFGMAATVTVVATFLSGLIVRRRIDHLDLIEVLKTRE
jgi:putative ABC transport system permease protein